MENVITLGKLISLLFFCCCFFFNFKNTRNELARPVMGTIFLVKRSEPHTGVFNRDFAWYIYMCRSVGMSVVCQINCVGGITCTRMLKAKFWAVKTDLWHPRYSFRLYARIALAWAKTKRSLRNEKLKAKRASETEEQRKERLWIRRE